MLHRLDDGVSICGIIQLHVENGGLILRFKPILERAHGNEFSRSPSVFHNSGDPGLVVQDLHRVANLYMSLPSDVIVHQQVVWSAKRPTFEILKRPAESLEAGDVDAV